MLLQMCRSTMYIYQFFLVLQIFGPSLSQPQISSNAIEWQDPEQCYARGTFFNAILMGCDKCAGEEDMEPKADVLNECQCKSGQVNKVEQQNQNELVKCAPCGQGLVVSSNGAYCVKCSGFPNNETGYPKAGKCAAGCSSSEIVQLDWTHSNRNDGVAGDEPVEKCVQCPEGTIPNGERTECVLCQDVGCICEKNISSPLCANLAPDAYSIPLTDSNPSGFASGYIKRNLRDAEFECRRGSRSHCEELANLCTLQDYARQSGGACAALESARSAIGQGQSTESPIVPQLFYMNIEASVEIFRENSIDAVFELNERKRNSQLDLVAMAFHANGTLLREWSARQEGFLQLCPSSRSELAYRFGNFFRQKCHLRVEDFYKLTKTMDHPGESTMFFELYLRYENTQGKIVLYSIPILNEDIRGDQYTGFYPNRVRELRRDSRVVLTKRFYTVDRQDSEQQDPGNENSTLIRVPTRILLHIHLQSTEGRIFIPYLQIAHEKIVRQQRSSPNETNQDNSGFDFEFQVLYHVDSFPYDKTIEVVMATACSLAAVCAALRAYSWGRRSGKMIIDLSTILKFTLYAAECISNVFLFVMGVTAVWLTFAYKLQSHMFYVPLDERQEGSFVAYLISATSLKAVSLVHTLISLVLVQTFFIDWERPRTMATPEKPIEQSKGEGSEKNLRIGGDLTSKHNQNTVVIWRTYLIANEWNELQLYRKTQLGIQLLLMLFLLDYLGFGNYAKLQPGFSIVNQPVEIIESRMSRFAVDISFYFAIAMTQWLLQVIIMERLADPFRNFMDLCSVANISVLAMTNPLRGFYIHGRSVHGFADTDMLQMNVFLQRERDNLCSLRGLEMGSDLQTFIINVPRSFRDRIDQIMAMSGNSAGIRQQQMEIGGGVADKTTLRVQQTARVYNELNEFLKDFVNRVDTSCDYQITDSRLIEELLKLELSDTSKVGIFIRDPSETEYSTAFLYGNEWVLMSSELALFCLVDMFWQSRVLAAFTTYLVSKAIGRFTKLFSTHQLARSSFVDNRFLI